MNRLLPVLILLIVSASLGLSTLYEYMVAQQKDIEIQQLKVQLDDSSKKLAKAENQQEVLSGQLNQTRNQVNQQQIEIGKLQAQVGNLTQQVANETAQVQKLEQQMKLKNYITIGLSFMWNPSLNIHVVYLHQVVDSLNQIWDPLHIYFFVYHAEAESFIPTATYCLSSQSWQWGNAALERYPGEDIPVAIFADITSTVPSLWGTTAFQGCSCVAGTDCPNLGVIAYVILNYPTDDAATLTEELFHVLGGITDQDFYNNSITGQFVPAMWYTRLQLGAKWFETPIPPDYFSG